MSERESHDHLDDVQRVRQVKQHTREEEQMVVAGEHVSDKSASPASLVIHSPTLSRQPTPRVSAKSGCTIALVVVLSRIVNAVKNGSPSRFRQ